MKAHTLLQDTATAWYTKEKECCPNPLIRKKTVRFSDEDRVNTLPYLLARLLRRCKGRKMFSLSEQHSCYLLERRMFSRFPSEHLWKNGQNVTLGSEKIFEQFIACRIFEDSCSLSIDHFFISLSVKTHEGQNYDIVQAHTLRNLELRAGAQGKSLLRGQDRIYPQDGELGSISCAGKEWIT